ncbi:MAG TPA: hypothetical protein RMG48_14515 [Myxococcales bacterium LLY-WYZ-16_1]|nr:hypothetical protein [Myxococcales bacterium LLY-WYZ-16_1]
MGNKDATPSAASRKWLPKEVITMIIGAIKKAVGAVAGVVDKITNPFKTAMQALEKATGMPVTQIMGILPGADVATLAKLL